MLSLLLALAAPTEQSFGDWAVACDNVKRCEATALQPPIRFGEDMAQVLVTRDAGADGLLSIAIDPGDVGQGPVTLWIDGRQVATGTIGDNYRIEGSAAEALAKTMAAGNALELRRDGKVLTQISLEGMSATLRYIDAEQGRANTPSALVALTALRASAVPAAMPLPRVPALRAASGAPESPSRKVLRAMAKAGGCDLSSVTRDLPVERYRLDAAATLVLIPCGSGAYNFNTAAFVLRGGKGVPAAFDTPPDWIESDDPPVLTNSAYSTIDGAVLSSSTKGRGIGDCGTSQRWVWDGARFRMIEARVLGECRGSINWLTVFRAVPEWR